MPNRSNPHPATLSAEQRRRMNEAVRRDLGGPESRIITDGDSLRRHVERQRQPKQPTFRR